MRHDRADREVDPPRRTLLPVPPPDRLAPAAGARDWSSTSVRGGPTAHERGLAGGAWQAAPDPATPPGALSPGSSVEEADYTEDPVAGAVRGELRRDREVAGGDVLVGVFQSGSVLLLEGDLAGNDIDTLEQPANPDPTGRRTERGRSGTGRVGHHRGNPVAASDEGDSLTTLAGLGLRRGGQGQGSDDHGADDCGAHCVIHSYFPRMPWRSPYRHRSDDEFQRRHCARHS